MKRQAYWRVEGQPGSPWHNMAVDAALLAALQSGDCHPPVVRVYEWDRPSVSIGRLQPEGPVQQIYPHLACVRRPTGGRAVVHGQDLTVSVVARTGWLPNDAGKTVLASYQALITGLATALIQAGHEVGFGSETPHGIKGSINCFEIAAGCDLIDVRTRRKLVGSAQRREGEAVLQQMSFPLALVPDRRPFLQALRRGFGDALSVEEWFEIDRAGAVCYTSD